jgi:hypothetical protein
LDQAQQLKQDKQLNISLDLSQEVSKGYRAIDQQLLKNHPFWR